ncbi:MAG TPA: tetratricopeptide repeat protein [Candidatus Poseidoniales archaeon]|nr:tetratricopeptide repeat protein [Candidatus Poseidoniales archaeon]
MRECQICGLLFLGTDCPGCGSRMTNVLDARGEGAQTLAQRGGLPGIERLGASLGSVLEDSEILMSDAPEDKSSLPFGVGGGASKRITTLPFGIGSNPSVGHDAKDTKLPSPEEIVAVSETEIPVEPEELANADTIDGGDVEGGAVTDENGGDGTDSAVQAEQPNRITAVPLEATIIETVKVVAVQVEPTPEVVAVPVEVPVAVAVQPTPVTTADVAVEVVAVEAVAVQPAPVTTADVAVEAVAVESVALVQSATTSHAEPDMEQIYAEEEKVVIHDFSDDLEPSEVMVNLDDLAEPVSESMVFSPTEVTDLGEPELFPAQALELGAEQGMEELALASQGFQAMANSMWDEAAVCFQQLAKKHPTDARIMNNYGLALLQRAISMQDDDHFSLIDGADTQFEAAIMALRQAAHSDPGEVTVLFNLGNALAGSGRYDKALRIFNAFLERSPPTSGALNGRAAAYIGLGRFDEATRDLNDAVSRFGDHPVLLSNLRRLSPA